MKWKIKRAIGKLRRSLGLFKPTHRIHLYTHHKVATMLTNKIFSHIKVDFGLNYFYKEGYQKKMSSGDIIHYAHSLASEDIFTSDHRGVHFTRDPRDIIVSGFLYHKRTSEAWCTNKNLKISKSINWPQIDYAQEHLSHNKKINYLKWLNGKSYQENIQALNDEDGLIFEMDGYAGRTIHHMANWKKRDHIIEVKIEDISSDFEKSWYLILSHLGFYGKDLDHAVQIALKHDMGRMSSSEIISHKHISTGKVTKWDDYFTEKVRQEYENRFGDIHKVLGYN